MTEDLIQLPDLKDIQDMLSAAKQDIQSQVQEEPDLKAASQLLIQVIDVVEEKLRQDKDLHKLSPKQKIDIAAHLSFLQGLLEDFFFFDEEDYEEEDEYEEEEEEK